MALFFSLINGLYHMAWFLIFGELIDVQTNNIFGPSNSYVSDLQTWHLIKGSNFHRL
jgi:hypothetical protein